MKERDEGYDSIRAIATVFIVLFHFLLCALEAKGIQATPRIISPLVDGYCNIGRLGVAWFSILSGCVLWKTYREGIDLKVFYRRRVLRLFIPLWISYAFFFIVSACIDPGVLGVPFPSILIALLGMDFYHYYFLGYWNLILVGEWYTAVIVTLYVVFPLVRYLFEHHRKATTAGMLLLFALNLRFEILTTPGGTWSVVNALVFFWLGMLFEERREEIVSSTPAVLTSLSMAAFILIFFRRRTLFGFGYLSTFLFAVSAFVLAYAFFSWFMRGNPVVRCISDLSYEIYLIHHRVFFLLVPVFISAASSRVEIAVVFSALAALILIAAKLLAVSSRAARSLVERVEQPPTKEAEAS